MPSYTPEGVPVSRQKLALSCPGGGKITGINEFGFFNPTNYERNGPVNPASICKIASNPTYWSMESWDIFANSMEYKQRLVDQKRIQKELGIKSSELTNEYNIDNKC